MLSTILDGKDGGMPLRGWRHGWPGYPRCIPVRQVIIPPKKITAVVSLNRQIYLEMCLWVTQKDERVFRKKVTACSIACFVRLWSCEHPECANPTTRRWAETHGKPWSRNQKAENRNHDIFIRWYQARSPGFPVYVGASKRSCNNHLNGKVSCSWTITTANPIMMYIVPDTITDCSISLFVSVERFAYKHDDGCTSLLWRCHLFYLHLFPHLLHRIAFLEPSKVKGYSCCEHPECANPHHTPVSRSAWKAVSRSRNLKAENRNHGIFTGRYQAGSPGFPVYGGVPIQPCNRAIGMHCFGGE